MAAVRMYSGNGGLALPLHLHHPLVPLHALLGHPVPPRLAAGVTTPTTGTLRAAMDNSAPSHMVATIRWEIAQVDAIRVAPISTMGNRNMLEMVWNVLAFLPNTAHQLLVSNGVVWRAGNFIIRPSFQILHHLGLPSKYFIISAFLPNTAPQLLVSNGEVWRAGNFIRGGLHDNRLIRVNITILIC